MDRRYYWVIFFLLISFHWSLAQSSLQRRLILVGDAGEVNRAQTEVIKHARQQVEANRTTVFFLGDNIYPSGYQNNTAELELRSQNILKSQYEAFKGLYVPVYFIPGNHDWAHSGKDGLKSIQAQGHFLTQLSDSLIQMIPKNGCPGPVEVNLSDNLTAIVLDSEWWMFPYERHSLDQDCGARSEEEVISQVESLFLKNRNKTVLLIAHHPLQTNGSHGGYFSWKDHVFPLTNVQSQLYVPLPVIGSLYPLLRRTALKSPEDLVHVKYKTYRDKLYQVFSGFPNVIYLGGHEHGLQLLRDSVGRLQVVSGSGAKETYLRRKPNALFLYQKQGYVILDYMSDRSVVLRYFEEKDGGVTEAFQYEVPYKEFSVIK